MVGKIQKWIALIMRLNIYMIGVYVFMIKQCEGRDIRRESAFAYTVLKCGTERLMGNTANQLSPIPQYPL